MGVAVNRDRAIDVEDFAYLIALFVALYIIRGIVILTAYPVLRSVRAQYAWDVVLCLVRSVVVFLGFRLDWDVRHAQHHQGGRYRYPDGLSGPQICELGSGWVGLGWVVMCTALYITIVEGTLLVLRSVSSV